MEFANIVLSRINVPFLSKKFLPNTDCLMYSYFCKKQDVRSPYQLLKISIPLLTEAVNCAIVLLTGAVNGNLEVRQMKNFLALSQEKQQIIINEAMGIFGSAGYKKAYISDIAAAAGISKASVFHYFGSKKALYLYLIEYAGTVLMNKMMKQTDNDSIDFFDRIMDATRQKMSVMKFYPALNSFLSSVYFEKDSEVAEYITELLSQSGVKQAEIAINGMDVSKFKDGVDPQHVLYMLTKFTEGVIGGHIDGTQSIDEIMAKLHQCINLLRNNLYKEEFLK